MVCVGGGEGNVAPIVFLLTPFPQPTFRGLYNFVSVSKLYLFVENIAPELGTFGIFEFFSLIKNHFFYFLSI